MPCFMQIYNSALILTCGLACCHPQGLPPPSQDPEVFSVGSHFHRQYFMENNDGKDNRDNNFDQALPSLLLACTYGNSLLCLKTCWYFSSGRIDYLWGPRILLLGCAQLTAPQVLLRGDWRHLVLVFCKEFNHIFQIHSSPSPTWQLEGVFHCLDIIQTHGHFIHISD